MKPLALVLFALLALSFIPLLSGQQAQALSAVTFTSLDTLTSQSTSTFQRVYENSTNSIIALDSNNTAAYFKSSYSISGDSVDSDTTTLTNTTFTADGFGYNSPVDLSRYSLDFVPASSQYVGIANDASLQIGTSMTYIGFVKFDAYSNGQHQTFLEKGPHANGLNYLFGKSDSNRLKFVYNDGSFRDVIESSGWTATNGVWYCIGIAVDKTNTDVLFYVDGTLKSTVDDPNGLNYASGSATGARIGLNGAGGEGFDGNLDDVRLYDSLKSASQIQNVCDGNDDQIDLAAWWDFNDGLGTSAEDRSSNSNTGTLTNSPTWSSDVATNSQSRLSHYITGRDTGSNVIGFAKLNTADLSEVDDEYFSSVYDPRDIVQSTTKLYAPATKSAGSGDLILQSVNRDFTSFAQTTLYNGTGAVPVWGKYYEQTNAAGDVGLDAATRTAAVEYVSSSSSTLVGKQLDRISLYLSKFGSPTGTATIGVFDSSINVVFTCSTQDVAALTGSATEYVYDCDGQYIIQAGDRIGFKFTSGSGSHFPRVHYQNVGTYDGTVSKVQWYNSGWTDLNSGNADLSGSFAQVQVKSAVYEGSPQPVYTFFESDDAIRVVKYTSSASLISTSMTHTNGQPFQIAQLTDRILIQTSSNLYQLLTSSDAITSLHTTAFPTRYPQTYSISPASQSFNSAAITIANSTYAINYTPSTGASARTGVLIENVTTGGSGVLTPYDPAKAYFLNTNDLVVDASSASATSWSIREPGTREQLQVTAYTEELNIDLVENTTAILDLDVIKLSCDNGNYLVNLEYFAVGDDSDCNDWKVFDTSAATTGRTIHYSETPTLVHADEFTEYTIQLSASTPDNYAARSIYDGETVDQGGFDSGGTLAQFYLPGQCYNLQIEESTSGNVALFGNICANDVNPKTVSLLGIVMPPDWLSTTWSHTIQRDFDNSTNLNANSTNNHVLFTFQKIDVPYNASVHVVDHPDSQYVTLDEWFNFTNANGITVINMTGINSNQTLYFTVLDEDLRSVINAVSSGQGFNLGEGLNDLGLLFGIPVALSFPLMTVVIFPKKYAYFGLIATGAAIGIMQFLGFFTTMPLNEVFWPVAMVFIALGVVMGVKQS